MAEGPLLTMVGAAAKHRDAAWAMTEDLAAAGLHTDAAETALAARIEAVVVTEAGGPDPEVVGTGDTPAIGRLPSRASRTGWLHFCTIPSRLTEVLEMRKQTRLHLRQGPAFGRSHRSQSTLKFHRPATLRHGHPAAGRQRGRPRLSGRAPHPQFFLTLGIRQGCSRHGHRLVHHLDGLAVPDHPDRPTPCRQASWCRKVADRRSRRPCRRLPV
mmetsp:Transcript_152063/g.269533  ORF Transcript_152063/g.269533 Transcript_152063/m.269533 type:complete len:214 (-) Transcript_152063:87-728(-)